jgi:hypothetical protein
VRALVLPRECYEYNAKTPACYQVNSCLRPNIRREPLFFVTFGRFATPPHSLGGLAFVGRHLAAGGTPGFVLLAIQHAGGQESVTGGVWHLHPLQRLLACALRAKKATDSWRYTTGWMRSTMSRKLKSLRA